MKPGTPPEPWERNHHQFETANPEAFFRDEAIHVVYVATEVDRHAELTVAELTE